MRKWLSDIRAEQGMTYKDFGAKICKPESYVCNLEHGKLRPRGLTVELLFQIADAVNRDPVEILQMEIDWLKGGTE